MIYRRRLVQVLASFLMVLPLIFALVPPASALAGDETVIGALNLVATFKSISVYSNFSSDNDGNNSVTMEYKKHTDAVWITGHPLTPDRRAQLVNVQLSGDGAAQTINNPWRNQWRGSIVGLVPNTQYDVRVRYSDPDGVTGSNPVAGGITTMDENIPLGSGRTYYVAPSGNDTSGDGSQGNPWKTIQKGVNSLAAGDTLYLRGGTYHETVAVAKSGNASVGYVTISGYPGETVIVDGSALTVPTYELSQTTAKGRNIYRTPGSWPQSIWFWRASDNMPVITWGYGSLTDLQTDQYNVSAAWAYSNGYYYIQMPNNDSPNNYDLHLWDKAYGFDITGNYVQIKDLTLRYFYYDAIHVQGNYHNLVISNISSTDSFAFEGSAGDALGNPNGPGDVVIRNSSLVVKTTFMQLIVPVSPGEPTAIDLKDTGGHFIIYGNTISGNGHFYDGVGGFDNDDIYDGVFRDSDIYNNTIIDTNDDGVEAEGGQMNTRTWGNTIIKNNGSMAITHAAVSLGPVYDFRNTIHTIHDSAWKLGGGNHYSPSDGYIYIYNNTLYSPYNAADALHGNGISGFGNTSAFKNVTTRNNIFHVDLRITERFFRGMNHSLDYDNFYSESQDPRAGANHFYTRVDPNEYNTLSSFQAATGWETHGINALSQWVDAANGDFRLQASSPNIDRGVVIPGFNDANSAWPYKGAAPDLGAIEFDPGGALSGSAPTATPPPAPPPASIPLRSEVSLVTDVDANGYAVLHVRVDRIVTGTEEAYSVSDGIGAYDATLTYEEVGVGVLSLVGFAPFFSLTVNLNSGAGQRTSFSARMDSPLGAVPPATVADIRLTLKGSWQEAYAATLNFTAITRTTGEPMPQSSPAVLTLRRGDADGNGIVNEADALSIAQYLARPGSGPAAGLNSVNAASTWHDDAVGDRVTIVDAMAIAQMLSGVRDENYALIP